MCSSYCYCGVPSSLLKPSNRHILPGLKAGAPVCQRACPTVAVVIHGAALEASYVQRLCVLLGSQRAVCAGMWLQAGLSQARTSKTAYFLQNQITKYREGCWAVSVLLCASMWLQVGLSQARTCKAAYFLQKPDHKLSYRRLIARTCKIFRFARKLNSAPADLESRLRPPQRVG